MSTAHMLGDIKAKLLAAATLPVVACLATSAVAVAPLPAFSVLTEPSAGPGPLYRFILSAKSSLDMTMYELADPTAERDLAADAARGVDVRVLLDAAYRGGSYNAAAAAYLESAGAHVKWGPSSVIVHEKTIVVDNRAAFVMTGNLTRQYYATSADFIVEDTKQADVATIVRAFDDDWSGDLTNSWYDVAVHGQEGDLVFSPGSESTLVGLLRSAQREVETSSEEMDSYAIENALEADARRGVDVEVLMTQSSSWDLAFRRLEAAGVHIRVYPRSANALYIHAKAVIIDNSTAYVGSINYSTASMVYNRELGLVTSSPAVVRPIASAWGRWWAAAPDKLS